MKIDTQTKALIFFNVAALAVGIIGVIAFKQLGAFNNLAPLKGVIMMGSAGVFFGAEVIGLVCKKKPLLFHEPVEGTGNYSVTIPGFETSFEFIDLQDKQRPLIKKDHFIVYSEKDNFNNPKFYIEIYVGEEENHSAKYYIADVFLEKVIKKPGCDEIILKLKRFKHQQIVDPITQKDGEWVLNLPDQPPLPFVHWVTEPEVTIEKEMHYKLYSYNDKNQKYSHRIFCYNLNGFTHKFNYVDQQGVMKWHDDMSHRLGVLTMNTFQDFDER